MANIKLTDATLRYPVPVSGKQRSILSAAAAGASFGAIGNRDGRHQYVEALSGVNLEIKDGERIGLIGRNGSGKSSLLKAISGLLTPSEGKLEVEGSVTAILRLGAGLNYERSARQNVPSLAKLLGIPRIQLPEYTKDLEEFTELGQFFDMPVRTYSAGMMVRFMFGAVTFKPQEILVVDEVITAGDAHFMEKAKTRATRLFKESKILILASHSADVLFELCDRLIWIDSGKVVGDGDPVNTWHAYLAKLTEDAKKDVQKVA